MVRTGEWRDSLVVTALDCWVEVRNRIEELEESQHIKELERVVGFVPDDRLQVSLS